MSNIYICNHLFKKKQTKTKSDNNPLLLPAQPRPTPLLMVAGLQPSPEPSNLMALLLYALPKRWRRRPAC
jgi:hypothetical protein